MATTNPFSIFKQIKNILTGKSVTTSNNTKKNTGNADFDVKKEFNFAYISNELLTGTSVNCKYTDLVVEDDSNSKSTETYFLKFQVREGADDMALDCLNNAIINAIITHQSESHFTEFIGYYIVNIYSKTVMADNEDFFFLTQPSSEYFNKREAKLGVQKKLTNAIELQKLPANSIKTEKLIPLFAQMQELAKYGFTHNDAHLGNLMATEDSYYLIDYGRVRFNKKKLDTIRIIELNSDKIKQILEKEKKDTYFSNYITNDPTPHDLKYMFDISTICLNIIFHNIVIEYDKYILIGGGFEIRKTFGLLRIKDIFIKINKKIDWNNLKNSRNPLHIGLYWLINYCDCVSKTSIVLYTKNIIKIDFESIVRNGYMHTYFQYIIIPNTFVYPQNFNFMNNTVQVTKNIISESVKFERPETLPIQSSQQISNPPKNFQQSYDTIIKYYYPDQTKGQAQQVQEKQVQEKQVQPVKDKFLPYSENPKSNATANPTANDKANKDTYFNPDIILRSIGKISNSLKDRVVPMSIDTRIPQSQKSEIPFNTSVTSALALYNAIQNPDKEAIKASFEAWLKEKAQLYLNDIYTRVNQIQSLIVFIYNMKLQDDNASILQNLTAILNKLYEITEKYISAITEKTVYITDVLIAYETEIIGDLFINIQSYIDHITSQDIVINYFFPPQLQRGGDKASFACMRPKTFKRKSTAILNLATLPTEPVPNCLKKAKQIFIEHLICNYPSPPPDWVYKQLFTDNSILKK